MNDSTVTKIDSRFSPHGELGQKYLASGKALSLRMWERLPSKTFPESSRPYETIGFVLEGKANLHLENQIVELSPGDSWVVPPNSRHSYEIIEPFSAVEATSPPAEVHGRDQAH